MIKNRAASVRQRLLNLSRSTGENFNHLLLRYGIERLLFRISQSGHADEFVLKGASLFYVWTGQSHRPTRDVDMLHLGPLTPDDLAEIVRGCAAADFDDGLRFDDRSIDARLIRKDRPQQGARVKMTAYLGRARIALQLDVGIGDAVSPPPEEVEYPSLLDLPAVIVRAYRLETAIAEKCEAMVSLELANTRLKDFYDVYVLASDREFDARVLSAALRDTFTRRGTAIPSGVPVAWTPAFFDDARKREQWRAFLRKSDLTAPELDEIARLLRGFLVPLFSLASRGGDARARWSGGRWVEPAHSRETSTSKTPRPPRSGP